jgi:hypothetical protein
MPVEPTALQGCETVVGSRTADMALPAGQEILDPLPLIIAQSIAVHVPASL